MTQQPPLPNWGRLVQIVLRVLDHPIGNECSRDQKESLGTVFKQACKAAGIKTKSAHGLRKAAATHAANNGATVAQLEAIFGWEGGQMASLYTRSANRKALADASMDKLSRRTK